MIFSLLTFTLIDFGEGKVVEFVPDFFRNLVVLPAQHNPQDSSDRERQDFGV